MCAWQTLLNYGFCIVAFMFIFCIDDIYLLVDDKDTGRSLTPSVGLCFIVVGALGKLKDLRMVRLQGVERR